VEGAEQESEARFAAYVGSLAGVLGHADRGGPLMDCCAGLLMPCERKSVEPIASMVAPVRAHQSLLHLVGQSAWSDEAMLAKVPRTCSAGVCGARRRGSVDRRTTRGFRRRGRIRSA
jgi:SRSO17 transposase